MKRADRKKPQKCTQKSTKIARRKRPKTLEIRENPYAEKWRKTGAQPALADGPRDRAQPLWAPEGVDLDFVPVEIQQSVNEIIKPVYEQFVVTAPDGLERSLGLTLCHLLWLEVLDQFDLKREYTKIDSVLAMEKDRGRIIDQHLRLIDSKVRIGYFLVRLRELRKRLANSQPDPVLDIQPLIPNPQSLIPDSQISNLKFPIPPPPPTGPPTLKKSNLDDQLETDPIRRARAYILAHPAFFSQQGFIAENYRTRNHRRFGPYYRLTFRHNDRQKSLYLGTSTAGAEEIRRLLADLQRTVQRRHNSRLLRIQIKRSLRRQKEILRKELAARGYYLKGFQIVRQSTDRLTSNKSSIVILSGAKNLIPWARSFAPLRMTFRN
jgi:hypothetical protein